MCFGVATRRDARDLRPRMDLGRINPVTLITGATSGMGAACAKDMGKRSQGGLILCDIDEKALSDLADELETTGAAPERVSTLAFDATDPDRWAQASSFIHSQYGRLDWAVLTVPTAAPNADTDLVDFSRGAPDLSGVSLALRTVMPLMRANTQGGAAVITAPASAIRSEPLRTGLLHLLLGASEEGAPSRVRLNAIATDGAGSAFWPALPWFNDLASQAGSDHAALAQIAALAPPLARAAAEDAPRLIALLLSDDASATGATLVVDGSGTL